MQAPHLFQFLSHAEWKFVFAIAFLVSEEYADWPIERYASEGTEGSDHSWEELFLRTMRYLVLEHGMQFEGVTVRPNGSVSAPEIVCEANINGAVLLSSGGLPDLPRAFETAIELAKEKVPSLDREPFHAALSKVHRDLKRVKELTNHDAVRKVRELRQAALRELNWVVIPMREGKPTIH